MKYYHLEKRLVPYIMFFISAVISLCLIGSAKSQGSSVEDPTYSHCQDITIPMCLELPYTKTVYPNLMGHASQDEASVEIYQYFPLIKVNCSSDIQVSPAQAFYYLFEALDDLWHNVLICKS